MQSTKPIIWNTKTQKKILSLVSVPDTRYSATLTLFSLFGPSILHSFSFLSGDSPSMEKWRALFPHHVVFHELVSVMETGGNSEAKESTRSVTITC